MPRLLIVLLVIAVVLVAGVFVLAGRAHERPLTHVEKVVPLGNLQN